ncbi:hypothetical protein X777_04092, partial [Ooceraea biroi]
PQIGHRRRDANKSKTANYYRANENPSSAVPSDRENGSWRIRRILAGFFSPKRDKFNCRPLPIAGLLRSGTDRDFSDLRDTSGNSIAFTGGGMGGAKLPGSCDSETNSVIVAGQRHLCEEQTYLAQQAIHQIAALDKLALAGWQDAQDTRDGDEGSAYEGGWEG